jgi:hypothetical protein
MPRHRERTTQKASWGADSLAKAIKSIKEGAKSIRQAAKCFGIPYTTLNERLKLDDQKKPAFGRPPVMNRTQEKELFEQTVLLSELFYGVTTTQLRKFAFSYAEKMNLNHSFNKEDRLAGKDWLEGFLKRNPGIPLRRPRKNRSTVDEKEVKMFFDNLEGAMERYKFPPDRVYNMDETGINTVQMSSTVLAEKSALHITVVCGMSASGSFVPPMFIYPRQKLTKEMKKNGPAGSSYHRSKTGWINEELFVVWLQHFVNFSKPDLANPVLLVLDNDSSHISLESHEICRKTGIVLVSLPPSTSHRMQPLDVALFAPLKDRFYEACRVWMSDHPGEKISTEEISGLFNTAFVGVATRQNAVSAFRKTGMYPADPDAFNREDLSPGLKDEECDNQTSSPESCGVFEPQSTTSPGSFRSFQVCDVASSGLGEPSCSQEVALCQKAKEVERNGKISCVVLDCSQHKASEKKFKKSKMET